MSSLNKQVSLTEAASTVLGTIVEKPGNTFDPVLVKAQEELESLLSSDLSEIDRVPLSEDSKAFIGYWRLCAMVSRCIEFDL